MHDNLLWNIQEKLLGSPSAVQRHLHGEDGWSWLPIMVSWHEETYVLFFFLKYENRGETKKILNIQSGWWKWTVMLTDNPQRPWSHYKLCLSPLLLLCFKTVFNYVSPEANYTNRHKQKYIFFLSDSEQQPFKPTDYMNLLNMSCQHNLQPKS